MEIVIVVSGSAYKSKDSDIVVLAEQLRCFSDLVSGFAAYRRCALKAEKHAGLAACFNDTVCKESQLLALSKLEGGFSVTGLCGETERRPFSSGVPCMRETGQCGPRWRWSGYRLHRREERGRW